MTVPDIDNKIKNIINNCIDITKYNLTFSKNNDKIQLDITPSLNQNDINCIFKNNNKNNKNNSNIRVIEPFTNMNQENFSGSIIEPFTTFIFEDKKASSVKPPSEKPSSEKPPSEKPSSEKPPSEKPTGDAEKINKELMSIINQIAQGYVDFSNKQVIQNKLSTLEEMIKRLESRGSTDQTDFLKKLFIMSQMQLNNVITKLGNNNHSYMETPSLPGITQFKPTGPSNIFSPLIDIRTSDPVENDRFSNAYEKGFREGIGGNTTNYINEETSINQSVSDSYKSADKITTDVDTDTNIRDSMVISSHGNKTGKEQNNNVYNQEKQYEKEIKHNNKTTQSNGYTKKSNDNLGIPGYSYLHPDHFDVPQQRNPVCITGNEPTRGKTALEPAGYLGSGSSNIMEFHSVGSILPKFNYKEEVVNKNDNTNRY